MVVQNAYGTGRREPGAQTPSSDYYRTTKAAVNRSKNALEPDDGNIDSEDIMVV